MTAACEPKRYLLGVSEDIERDALDSARSVVGNGYIDEYYASIASEFMWLYGAGFKDGVAKERKRKRRKSLRPNFKRGGGV